MSRDAERFYRLEQSIRTLWGREECVILACPSCGFGFAWPFVGGDERFYSILHEQMGYPSWRWDYTLAKRDVLNRYEGGNLLDVGAGDGTFLRSLGPEWKRHAVEASDRTRAGLESKGIRVFRDLSEARTQGEEFQVVTLFQFLEHVCTFQESLAQCRELLSPGGRIVITVPNGEMMVQQESRIDWPDMPPNHVARWTPTSLALALERNGFSVDRLVVSPWLVRNFKDAIHMKILSQAANPRSVAAQVFRIRNKTVRVSMLALLAVPVSISLFPSACRLARGNTLAVVASKS